ncbi:sodium:solute symporter [soil metagenome]
MMPLAIPLAVFSRIDWLVVGAYLALMAVIGTWASRRKTDAEGYFLAERRMPTFAVALSLVATSLSVATFVGAPQESFNGDLTYLSLNLGGFLAVLVVATLFIPRLYRAGTMTIYGYIDQRFGETAKIALSCMFLLGRLLASGARLFIAAIPLCLLIYGTFEPTRWQLICAIMLIGAVGTAYTIAGGIRAVIWTDTAQITIVFGTLLLSIGLLLWKIPLDLGGIANVLCEPVLGDGHSKLRLIDFSLQGEYTIWTALIGSTFLSTAVYGVDHDFAQRMLTAKSAWRGSISLIVAQVIGLIVVSAFIAVGLLLYIFYKRPDVMGAAAPLDQVQTTMGVYPQFLLAHMPRGCAGLAIAGMFAAAQGSLDSAINAMASSAVADLYWPIRSKLGYAVDTSERARSPRIAVAIMGAVLIGFAILSALRYDPRERTLLNFALGVMSFAYSGMLGVFLTARLTRRGNTASVLAALVSGVIVVTLLQDSNFGWMTRAALGRTIKLPSFWWMPIATTIAFAVCLLGSPDRSRRKNQHK